MAGGGVFTTKILWWQSYKNYCHVSWFKFLLSTTCGLSFNRTYEDEWTVIMAKETISGKIICITTCY